MNKKRISGIVIFIIGVILIVFSVYERNRVAHAKSEIHSGTSILPENPISGMVGGALQKKAASYDAPLLGVLIAGIILVIVGFGMTVFCKSKPKS